MKRMLFFWGLIVVWITGHAQTRFVTSGKIEFERKTNVYRLFFNNESESFWTEQIKKQVSRFRIDYFDLVFTEAKTLYKPGRSGGQPQKNIMSTPAADNVVYKDLLQQQMISRKQVFEGQFLLLDSLPSIEWKIQPETRTIAGFECRKAVGRICDSVVVVAFYTDEIIPASGPESFHGLPGMILGLAIPRLYTTWFATKLELLAAGEERTITAPAKGKKATTEELIKQIDASINDWGETRTRTIWFTSL